MSAVDEECESLLADCEECVDALALRALLERARREGRPLRVKLGVDPRRPDLTVGHAVVLGKLRTFQRYGHTVIFLVGDYTARIGDPTGQDESRPQLTADEVRAHARTYLEQAARVLDVTRAEVRFNSEWLAPLSFQDVIRLASTYTVARMLEREDFQRRFHEGRPIHLHEFFYPLMQGYDSVALRADVELGGMDQKFNLLVGRHLQREFGLPEQVLMLMPLLPGTDGAIKMGKSLGNAVHLTDPPAEMYGKLMSIPDTVLDPYIRLAARFEAPERERLLRGLAAGTVHPRTAKAAMARNVVALYHGEAAARAAEEHFERVFQRHEAPEDAPEVRLPDDLRPFDDVRVSRLVVALGLARSQADARRLISQGAVSLDGTVIRDPMQTVAARSGALVRVGKRRFARIALP